MKELFKQNCPCLFRLIKVEEELRKEQVEMHKLLKAKQDLIDIQKKRIEHLTNRTSNANQNLLSNSTKSIGNNTNIVKNSNNNNSIFQQLTNSIVAESSQSKDAWVPSGVLHVDKLSPQIAASPSSSSSSMTQFCKYLAQNTLIQPTQAGLDDLQASYLQNQSKRKNSYHQNQLEDALSKSSPRILSPTPHDVNGAQVDGTPSSTSSSSSALSTSSSLNHLNHPNHPSTNTTSSNNNNNNSSNVNGSSFNFFRTSEL